MDLFRDAETMNLLLFDIATADTASNRIKLTRREMKDSTCMRTSNVI